MEYEDALLATEPGVGVGVGVWDAEESCDLGMYIIKRAIVIITINVSTPRITFLFLFIYLFCYFVQILDKIILTSVIDVGPVTGTFLQLPNTTSPKVLTVLVVEIGSFITFLLRLRH
jgi:hypothetical protein